MQLLSSRQNGFQIVARPFSETRDFRAQASYIARNKRHGLRVSVVYPQRLEILGPLFVCIWSRSAPITYITDHEKHARSKISKLSELG